MIENERQYKSTRSKLAELEQARPRVREGSERYSPRIGKALRAATESQIEDLKREIREYEELCQRRTARLTMKSLVELGDCLIKARLFRGYTQAELAERLHLHAQQIQRYEASRYESARLARLVDVMEALEIELRGVIDLDKNADNLERCNEDRSHVKPFANWSAPEGVDCGSGSLSTPAASRAQGIIREYGLWGCKLAGHK